MSLVSADEQTVLFLNLVENLEHGLSCNGALMEIAVFTVVFVVVFQREYEYERISWKFLDYTDNQPCLDVIEGQPSVFGLLNEVSNIHILFFLYLRTTSKFVVVTLNIRTKLYLFSILPIIDAA